MDALKAQFEKISQQLSALTATQKMLVAALVAVMVLTMLYWGKYAGNAEMVPVLDQALTEEDIGPITQQLKLAGVLYKVESGKVLVPSERKDEILATLMFARALPSDTHSAFEQMNKTLTPFSSNNQTEAAYTQATALELSQLISMFPGVSYAHVVINAKSVSRVEGSIPPSATVIVNTRGEIEHIKTLVKACSEGVAHAVSNLKRGQISVIVNGSPFKLPDEDQAGGGDYSTDEIRKNREAELEQKIRDSLKIDGVTVAVNCDVENRTTTEDTIKYDKPVSTPEKVNTLTTETNSSSPSREPGATPNTGSAGSNGAVSLDGSSGGAAPPNTSSTTSKEETTNKVAIGSSGINIKTPPGKETVKTATVRVPRSYFLAIYKIMHPKSPEMSDAEMLAFSSTELANIRDGVKHVVGLKSEDDLSVGSYVDIPQDMTLMAAAAAPSAVTTVSGHAREIGVAVLAIISLMMMATMVRKSTPPPLVLAGGGGATDAATAAVAAARAQLNAIGSGESVEGEVGAGVSALDAVEMDEEAVRTQQMLEQVSTMVKENPDGAASLVKRWLSRV